jgi:hypothetical protein
MFDMFLKYKKDLLLQSVATCINVIRKRSEKIIYIFMKCMAEPK